jgi:hypothetical protein
VEDKRSGTWRKEKRMWSGLHGNNNASTLISLICSREVPSSTLGPQTNYRGWNPWFSLGLYTNNGIVYDAIHILANPSFIIDATEHENTSKWNITRVFQSVQRLRYGLDDRGSIPGRGKKGLFRHSVQTGSGAQPVSNTMCIGVHSPAVKLTTHLHLVLRLMCGAIPSLSHTSLWRGATRYVFSIHQHKVSPDWNIQRYKICRYFPFS